jgi:long-chain fatty acid transport protein
MRKIGYRGALAAGLLLIGAPAHATNGMRMIGFGPVQDSMGGASVGVPLDAATVVTNPAGMTGLGARADAAFTWFSPTVKYEATDALGATSGRQIESRRLPDVIPTLAGIFPVCERLTLGLAAVGTSGMGVEYRPDLFGSRTETSYMNLRVAPAASFKIIEGLSVGVSANLQYALMGWNVMGAMGNPERKDGTSFGYGATVGVLYRPMKLVTVGAAWETKSTFADFEFDLGPVGKEKLKFDQPQVATFGVSVAPIDALVVAADVEWINWSATNGKNQPKFTQATPASAPWNMNWSDQWVVKVGAQWAATQALKVRAGYDYGKMPLDAKRSFENIAFPAVAEHHVTVGVGVDAGPVTINAAAVYSPEAKIAYVNPAPSMTDPIMSYTSRMSQVAVDLGVAYRF